MNWKATLHSAVVALAGIVVGAIEQYIQNGGVIPQNSQQWHTFFLATGGTILTGVLALLKQSPLSPPNKDQK